MKKITRIFSVFISVFLFATTIALANSTQKVSAAPAPRLTQFQIVGLAKPSEFNGQGGYIPRNQIDYNDFDSNVYIITRQMGYGNISYSIDGGSYRSGVEIVRSPIQGYDSNGARAVVGWITVQSISGLSSGNHTIRALCNSTVGYGSISDAITISVR